MSDAADSAPFHLALLEIGKIADAAQLALSMLLITKKQQLLNQVLIASCAF